jgi:hypothetical protein
MPLHKLLIRCVSGDLVPCLERPLLIEGCSEFLPQVVENLAMLKRVLLVPHPQPKEVSDIFIAIFAFSTGVERTVIFAAYQRCLVAKGRAM